EIYGFPKVVADFRVARGPRRFDGLTLETHVIRRFGAEARAGRETLLEIAREEVGAGGRPALRGSSMPGRALASLLAARYGQAEASGIGAWLGRTAAARLLVRRGARLVVLKEFPDARQPPAACYQRLVAADASITAVRDGGRLPGRFRIAWGSAESHPVARELGLPATPHRPIFASWFDFDFTMGIGREL